MNRRNFLTVTGTLTGGTLLLPDFLFSYGAQPRLSMGEQSVVFIQLNGGNDGLNTFIPIDDPLYHEARPAIGLHKDKVIGKDKGMAFHPALKGFADIQQQGDLTVIQNVGYPHPNRSHFRSREIWQTATPEDQYLNEGWLGRYLELQCKDHNPTAGINLDNTDNLALLANEPNFITVKNPNQFKYKNTNEQAVKLSDNPQLDFARKIANSVTEGSEQIQQALKKAKNSNMYPKSGLGRNLQWIARLIKGNLNTKVYYTSLGGFDTHNNQLGLHARQLTQLNNVVHSFYKDLKQAGLLQNTTIVIFSEFGRRVRDNGKGTDHGTAAPMFIIGGNNKGTVIGQNPNLADLDQGDLKYETDFRSVYAALLKEKLDFNHAGIGIKNKPLQGIF
ncbi:DUF1501 domain-containing protein [Sinomicrobium weinanense]|uniref:DUF1501 domain-containing protein n=1 Tax=Sinomicrobium weinanense TaxID=2842200 RepID=A0A926JRQ0_9FLAO|nr:DUF1501 domain-containing protein [Sinomicrobium weinanense]MBC9796011.1 DUF1501 domain-containing protein [Sinomicrobium weinanense]MBU3123170.1 DUF1501 domain-containing protein [Sinomicrobium weinanense]